MFRPLFLICLLCCSSAIATASELKPIVMASHVPLNRATGKFLQLVYTEAFKRLGFELVYKYYPAARASAMSDLGRVDGEITRIHYYGKNHPALVRVDEPAYTIKIAAFAVDPAITLTDWNSLSETQYRVEFRRGGKIVEDRLELRVPPENLSAVNSVKQGLQKLLAGYSDIYVMAESEVFDLLRLELLATQPVNQKFNFAKIRKVCVLEEVPAHAFLNKRYRDLAPKLSPVLKVMKKEGLIEKYRQFAQKKV